MKKNIPLLMLLVALFLVACNLSNPLPENPISATTPNLQVTILPAPTISPSPQPAATLPAPPLLPIVYYYFVTTPAISPPPGSVVILPDVLILGPTHSEITRGSDTAANVSTALRLMIQDSRTPWTKNDVSITRITFRDGKANVVLQGNIFGAGDVVFIAARMQILLTVFAEPSVQTAVITINGENVANLGISHSSQEKPADYTFTRAEIETFIAENAYKVK